MELELFFHRGKTQAPPKRITIRRRLVGRGSRLRTLGLAAGLLGLGLTLSQPAHASSMGSTGSTKNWDGSTADWYSDPAHWTLAGFPQPGDDARNTFTNAAMTLAANASVNSFISNSAFSLNGGTFSGSTGVAGADTANLHILQVNNIFTLDGGTINNFTLQAGVKQASGPVPAVIVTGSGGNALDNTVVNATLDLATNSNAYLRLFDTNTINGALNLGAGGGNGLHLYNSASTLVTGSTGNLSGFGSVVQDNGGATITNNGIFNASNAAGNVLTLGVTTFNNNGTLEATNGGALALSNTFTNNSGALKAVGAGSLVTLTNGTTFTGTGTAAQGNLITASGGGKVVVDGATLLGTINGVGASTLVFNTNAGNNFSGTTANINLDLTSGGTGYLRLFNADTVNGAITLGAGGGNGLHLYSSASNLTLNGALTGFGSVVQDNGGATVTNNSTINANSSAGLTLGVTNFNNSAGATTEATNGGALALSNAFTNNSGALKAVGAGSIVNLANGTTFTGSGSAASGNLITASGGGKVVVDGVNLRGTINTAASTSLILTTNGGNNLDNTTVNGNLDLATNSNAYARLFDTDTVNGNISLGENTSGNGLHLYSSASNLVVGSTGTLQGFGYVIEDNGGSTVTNNGLINANSAGNTLNINTSNFNNTGTAQVTNGAILSVTSTNATNSGVVNVLPGGTATFASGLTQTAGLTQVDGVLNLVNNSALTLNGTTKGGTLLGSGQINGNVVNTNGIVSPGDSPGTLTINGNYTQGSAGSLNIEFLGTQNGQHDLLNILGLSALTGTLDVNYLGNGSGLAVGSQFAFLDYGTLSAPTVGGLTQYFLNETPLTSNTGTVVGHNGFTYELINDTASKMLDLQVLTVGAPAVPEASTTVSLGLLLALGMGGLVVASKRKKKA